MTFVSDLPVFARNALCIVLFCASLSQLFLGVYRWISCRSRVRCIADTALFALLLVVLSVLRASYTASATDFTISMPWLAFLLPGILMLIYSVFGLVRMYKSNRSSISSSSIRETLDNLNSGICFADKTGRIILINRAMSRLLSSVGGSVPQTIGEIEALLVSLNINGAPGLYRFPDDSIRRFVKALLSGDGLDGFVQLTAQDVTELYEISESLRRENEELRKTNEELGEMYERLADRIREQETLNLKMQIHNDIGTSLISISKIIEENGSGNTEAKLENLRNAVSYFSNYRAQSDHTADALRDYAARLNVTLVIDGVIPAVEAQAELLSSAIRECVTNCVTHAGGNVVKVRIRSNTVSITNNGKAPTGEMKEGGGLTSLRKHIESSGGEMRVYSAPEFMLKIIFKTETRNV